LQREKKVTRAVGEMYLQKKQVEGGERNCVGER